MFKWITKADTGADVVVRWGGIYLIVAAALSWLNRQLPWFSTLGWPELIFIAVWMALIVVFLVAASLALFRYFRPLPDTQTRTPARRSEQPFDDAVAEAFRKHGERLRALEQKVPDPQTARERNAKVERMAEEVLRQDAYFRNQVVFLYLALAAIGHRDRLYRLSEQIHARAKLLCRPTEEKDLRYGAEQWEVWQTQEAEWRTYLERWCSYAQLYKGEAQATVFETPAEHYKQSWSITDDQFPGSTAVYEYKTFRIILRNWTDLEGEVMSIVHGIAFAGAGAPTRPVEIAKPRNVKSAFGALRGK